MANALFKGMKDAQVFERGNWMQPDCLYDLEIKRTFIKDTLKIGPCFIVEFLVLKSTCDKHPPGSKVTWLQKLTNKNVAFGALKLFTYPVLDAEYPKDKKFITEEIDPQLEEFLTEACETNNWAGRKVRCQTVGTKTKEKNEDFTQHNWSILSA